MKMAVTPAQGTERKNKDVFGGGGANKEATVPAPVARISTGIRSPRFAVQHVEVHRHFRLDGWGYHDHAHGIGKRVHEHLAARLGAVMLSWAQLPPKDMPIYEEDADSGQPIEDSIAFLFIGTLLVMFILFGALLIVSGLPHPGAP